MNYPKVLSRFPESAGLPYKPSNGTEGAIFMEAFCENCMHENPNPDVEPNCEILTCSVIQGSVEEWVYSQEGWPICSNWKKWDWDNDGDPNDPENPLAPLPDNEFQLLIPFSVFELLGIEGQGVVETRKGIFEVEC